MLEILTVVMATFYQSGQLSLELDKVVTGEKLVITSWYGQECQGREMAYGGKFDKNDPRIAAHKTLPPKTKLELRNPATGKKIRVQILDHGPHVEGRDLDISEAAAKRLGFTGVGPLLARIITD